MKIVKFRKEKQGKYILQLADGIEIETYEDLILKYDLLIQKEISPDILKKIEEENKVYEIYFISLKYIKTRMRSIQEMREYLLKKGYSIDDILSSIELLKKQGYLNDQLYAESYMHDHMNLTNDGPLKIKAFLEKLEINSDFLDSILSTYTEDIECGKIDKLIEKQVRSNHSKSSSTLKQKIKNNLIILGYHSYLIDQKLSLLESADSKDEEIYQKEYQKLYRKLSRKYEGKELVYQIKQRLYRKGFHID